MSRQKLQRTAAGTVRQNTAIDSAQMPGVWSFDHETPEVRLNDDYALHLAAGKLEVGSYQFTDTEWGYLNTYLSNHLEATELAELQNINSVSISNEQWGYLGSMDQGVATTYDVAFSTVDIDDSLRHTGDTDTRLTFATNEITLQTGGTDAANISSEQLVRLPDYNTNVLEFDGSTTYIQINTGDLGHDYVTVEALIDSDAWNGSGINEIVDAESSNSSFILRQNSGVMEFYVRVGSSWHYATTGSNYALPPNDNWVHIAGVFDGTNVSLLIGGVPVDTTAVSGTLDAFDLREIGRYQSSTSRHFDGTMAEVRVWSVARTDTEIRENMHKRLTGTETGLVAYYRLDEGTGTTATDSAGSNDGTITGGSWTTDSPLPQASLGTGSYVAGNLGIGTARPFLSPTGVTAGLHVVNNKYIQGRFESYDASAGIELIPNHNGNSTANDYEIQANESGDWFVYNRTDGRYDYRIDGSGNHKFAGGAGSGGVTIDSSGNVTVSGITEKSGESWQNVSFNSGFSHYGSGYKNCQYKKFPDGRVQLQGLCSTSSTGILATLPAGYRPTGTAIFICRSSSGYIRVDVQADGDIRVADSPGGWVSLEAILFDTQ